MTHIPRPSYLPPPFLSMVCPWHVSSCLCCGQWLTGSCRRASPHQDLFPGTWKRTERWSADVPLMVEFALGTKPLPCSSSAKQRLLQKCPSSFTFPVKLLSYKLPLAVESPPVKRKKRPLAQKKERAGLFLYFRPGGRVLPGIPGPLPTLWATRARVVPATV